MMVERYKLNSRENRGRNGERPTTGRNVKFPVAGRFQKAH